MRRRSGAYGFVDEIQISTMNAKLRLYDRLKTHGIDYDHYRASVFPPHARTDPVLHENHCIISPCDFSGYRLKLLTEYTRLRRGVVASVPLFYNLTVLEQDAFWLYMHTIFPVYLAGVRHASLRNAETIRMYDRRLFLHYRALFYFSRLLRDRKDDADIGATE